eukprot:Gb_34387 [translate_table: standard]
MFCLNLELSPQQILSSFPNNM